MDKFLKAVNDFLNPPPPSVEPTIDWDVPPAEIQRVTWAYAHLTHCSYTEAKEQLCYMTYADAKEFLGEG